MKLSPRCVCYIESTLEAMRTQEGRLEAMRTQEGRLEAMRTQEGRLEAMRTQGQSNGGVDSRSRSLPQTRTTSPRQARSESARNRVGSSNYPRQR